MSMLDWILAQMGAKPPVTPPTPSPIAPPAPTPIGPPAQDLDTLAIAMRDTAQAWIDKRGLPL